MTRPGPDHERWAPSIGAYLLGAVPDDERAHFEAHAAECPACHQELAELRVAAAALPASVPPVEPPASLKGRVMAEVEREAALLAAAGPSADRAAAPRRRRWAWPRWAGVLAGAAATAVVVAVLVGDRGGTTTFPATMDRAQVARGAQAELRVGDDAATLVATGLRAPEAGRVYQVWVQRPGQAPEPTSSLFTPRADGSATTAVPAALDDGDAVLVTSEPRGGSRAPTRAPLLSAALR